MLMLISVQCFVTLLYYDIKIFIFHKAIYVHYGFVTRSRFIAHNENSEMR